MSTNRKVLVVTGASQGLGEGFVKAYRDRGWRVVGNSRSIKPSDDPDYITVPGDAGTPDIARKVVETALDRFGRVDTLINNAGIWRPGPIESISEDLYRRVMATNVDSVFFATQAAVPAMKKQGRRPYHLICSHKPGRTRGPRRSSGSSLVVKGRLRCRNPWTRHGTRVIEYPSQRGFAWHHQDAATRGGFARSEEGLLSTESLRRGFRRRTGDSLPGRFGFRNRRDLIHRRRSNRWSLIGCGRGAKLCFSLTSELTVASWSATVTQEIVQPGLARLSLGAPSRGCRTQVN